MLKLEERHVCRDCGEECEDADLQPLPCRVRLGEREPSGSCPDCGGTCEPVEDA